MNIKDELLLEAKLAFSLFAFFLMGFTIGFWMI